MLQFVLAIVSTSVLGLVGEKVLGKGGASELFVHQAGEEQQRLAWPMVHHDVQGLPVGVAGHRADDAEGLALDLRGVVLEEAVVAVGPSKVEVLELSLRGPSARPDNASDPNTVATSTIWWFGRRSVQP
jgi:hypothetical protein